MTSLPTSKTGKPAPKGLPRTAYGLRPSDKAKLLSKALEFNSEPVARRAISLVGRSFYNRAFHHPEFTSDKVAQIDFDRIVFFRPPMSAERRAELPAPERKHNPKGKTTGYFTKSAAKRMRKALSPWVVAVQVTKELNFGSVVPVPAYLVLATFTLPAKQVHSDNELKRQLLMPFIQHLMRTGQVTNYLWRAEPQANGNLHFHIFFDRFIDKEELRDMWNGFLSRLGYIDIFESAHGHRNAPTTHICKCPDSMHLVNYVMKYAGKMPMYISSFRFEDGKRVRVRTPYHKLKGAYTDKEGVFHPAETSDNLCVMRPIQGRQWGCSDALRSVSVPVSCESEALAECSNLMQASGQFKVVQNKDFTAIFGPVDRFLEEHCPGLWFWWLSWAQHNFNRLYSTKFEVHDMDIGNPDKPPTSTINPINSLIEAEDLRRIMHLRATQSTGHTFVEVPF